VIMMKTMFNKESMLMWLCVVLYHVLEWLGDESCDGTSFLIPFSDPLSVGNLFFLQERISTRCKLNVRSTCAHRLRNCPRFDGSDGFCCIVNIVFAAIEYFPLLSSTRA
jgi:hypothetical protein